MRDAVFLPAASLWRREMVRFVRQPSRIVGSLGAPLLFWLLLGVGMGASFRAPGTGEAALVYFFPGALALVILFTSIFANISVIEDRHEGFLQGVLAAPVSRAALVLGKVLGGATVATAQAGVLLALAAAGGLEVSLAGAASLAAAVVLLSVALGALGFACAWRIDSVQGFHGVMNLLLMPLWLLSGALFPREGLPRPLDAVVRANPLTHGVDWIRASLAGDGGWDGGVTAAFAGLALLLAVLAARR